MRDQYQEIYVYLKDEGTDVWRPVKAKKLDIPDIFEIVEQNYDRADEKWEFEPGDKVRVEIKNLSQGPALVAVAKVI